MADRTPYRVPDFRDRENIRLDPKAAPVNTYAPPPIAQGGEDLMALARGLSALDSGLSGYLQQRKGEQEAADKARAEADFHNNNRLGFAEAVSQGIIPAWTSKAYVQTYKKAEGRVAGQALQQQFQSDYDKWGGKNDQNPGAFDLFVNGWLKDKIKTKDPEVLKGLLPSINAIQSNGLQRNMQDRHNALVKGKNDLFSSEINIALDEAHKQGLASGKGTDYTTLFGYVDAMRGKYISEGTNPMEADKRIVDAITAKALERRDPNLLKLLDRKVPGSEVKYGDTEYGSASRQQTLEKMDALGRRMIAEQEKQKSAAEQAAREDVTRRTIQLLSANSDAPIPEELMVAGERLDGDYRTKVIKWRETIRSGASSTNPEALRDLHWELIRSGGRGVESILQRGLERGILNNKSDLDSAFNLGEKMKKGGSKVESIVTASSTKNIVGAIKQRTLSSDDLSNPFAPDGMSNTGLAMKYDFETLLSEWAIKNPEATAMEREKAINDIGASILNRIERKDGIGKETYNRDPNVGFQNPWQGQAPAATQQQGTPPQAPQQDGPGTPAPPQQPPAAPPTYTPPAPEKPKAALDPKAMEWYLGLQPEKRQQAEQMAKQGGFNLQDFIGEAYKRQPQARPQAAPQQQQQDTPPASPISYTPGAAGAPAAGAPAATAAVIDEQAAPDPQRLQAFANTVQEILKGQGQTGPATRNFTLAVLRDDPKAAQILDFVSGPESSGNYNAYYGNAGSTKDLSTMTINEVLAWQKQRVNQGSPSSATGRYQFMQKTLEGLKEELGFTGDEKFTPQLQDNLALALLRRRGYDKFRTGAMDAQTFARNLAMEWAGLPDPTTGRSYYAGDGLNKSGVSVKSVMDTLGKPGGATPQKAGRFGPGDVYANIPEKDSRGEDQIAKFIKWNPDPVGNHEKNLNSVDTSLASVIRKAQADNPDLKFVVGSGKREADQQDDAVKAGWSKTQDSNHLRGEAVDLWPLDEKGRVIFDPKKQAAIGAAIKKAAAEAGVKINWGGDWKGFKDLPHFEVAPKEGSPEPKPSWPRTMDNKDGKKA